MARGWKTKQSKGKQKYEDIEKYYRCPTCGETVDNHSWHCRHCGFSATVYNILDDEVKPTYTNMINTLATDEIRSSLVRINPWTGDDY